MPIYMDRHDVSDVVTAENVAQLHQEDLKVQHKFNCNGLTYWFDDKRKTAFCLVEAPNKQSVINMHDHAHGVLPHLIIEVEASIVESFLGRIEDPVMAKSTNLNIINDPAFRTLMKVGLNKHSLNGYNPLVFNSVENKYSRSVAEISNNHSGRIVSQKDTDFLISFASVTNAVKCAQNIQSKINEIKSLSEFKLYNIKIGISAGVPVTEKKIIFEDTIKLAERMHHVAKAEIVVSSEVKDLYKSENLNQFPEEELIVTLSPTDEIFLTNLIDFIENEWKNNNLNVNDFNNHLGYSKSQLYRKMMTLIGESPNTFLMSYRLNKAVTFLNKQIENISEIAYDSGFSTPSYFSKCFHRRYGILPSDYLRANLK